MRDDSAPRLLTTRRTLLLALVAPLVVWVLLEGAATLVLGAMADPEDELAIQDPEWLMHARNALAGGFFQPDPDVLWTLTPDYEQPTLEDAVWGDEPLRLNAFGHRSPAMPRDKPEGVRRVMVLGGSHPFGMWVGTSEAYPTVLEGLLNAAGPHRWQVLNAAAPGHTTFQGRRYLETVGWEFAPDVVVFDLGMNDRLPLSLDFAAPDHEVAAVPTWASDVAGGASRSAVYRLLRVLLEPPVSAARKEDRMRVPLERRIDNLRAVQQQAEERGASVLYVSQVYVHAWRGPGAADCYFDPAQHGFTPRADVCGLFTDLSDDAGTHFVDSVHADARGHRLIAERIFATLQQAGWTR